MRYFGLLLLTVSMCNFAVGDPPVEEIPALKMMTWNIRYDNPADGKNAWRHRKDWVASIMLEQGVDIICCQEVLVGQLEDLKERLPDMEVYGVGRNDGQAGGEFVPIFFRKTRFKNQEQGTFWLSPTPQQPGSKGWDAQIPRIVSWVKLFDRQSTREFYVLNTHFDHVGGEARNESARLLTKMLPERFGNLPTILMGDLNTLPGSEPYNLLIGKTQAGERFFFDAYEQSETKPEGPISTWNGFGKALLSLRIDYIFTTAAVRVLRLATLDDQREGRYPSDHYPMVAEVRISAEGHSSESHSANQQE